MIRLASILLLLLAGALPAAAAAPKWALDEGSRIDFTITQGGNPQTGQVTYFEADIGFAPDNLAESRVDIAIDSTGMTLGGGDQDKALRSAAFLDVEAYPEIRFVAEDFAAADGGYVARGTLTIRGIPKPAELPFTFTPSGDGATAEAEGSLTLDRRDFEVGTATFPDGSTLGTEVEVSFSFKAHRVSP